MTELSGTLEGVGLPAIIRFLTGLNKTGCLRIVHDDWQGEILTLRRGGSPVPAWARAAGFRRWMAWFRHYPVVASRSISVLAPRQRA
jgi:hypothetical protein